MFVNLRFYFFPLTSFDLTLFFHEKEVYTIISNGKIWSHNLSNIDNKCVIPLLTEEDVTSWNPIPVYGVCSDYIGLLK